MITPHPSNRKSRKGLASNGVSPRLVDLISDTLDLSCDLGPDEEVEYLILDFVDALWNIPPRFGKRRFVGLHKVLEMSLFPGHQ